MSDRHEPKGIGDAAMQNRPTRQPAISHRGVSVHFVRLGLASALARIDYQAGSSSDDGSRSTEKFPPCLPACRPACRGAFILKSNKGPHPH
eukprot:COSAG01_NODE_3161_length_6481_cov_89.230962_11_plen_91_part_00